MENNDFYPVINFQKKQKNNILQYCKTYQSQNKGKI